MRKALVPDGKARVLNGGRLGQCFQVLVESDQVPLSAQTGKNQPAVPTPAKGTVHIGTRTCVECNRCVLGAVQKRINRFIQQHGGVCQ